jgi:aspartyl-tRNA(Asn)/glutamyl-tRNA(Gln) amidotransferase subunit A
VKDLYDVAGHVTSACSAALRDSPPATADAPAVAALRRAGAIIIGKTNMHELAFGATNTASCYGPANNPWGADRSPGGSSGGSGAAVGARIVGLALGTDTGGSIRIPSSLCGVTGLKTTWGLLSTTGVTPMTPSLDSVGPIATDAIDARRAFEVLTGSPSPLRDIAGMRIGVGRGDYLDVVTDEIAASMMEAARVFGSLGAVVSDVDLPWLATAYDAWLPVALAEFGREHRALQDRLDDLDPGTRIILMAGIGLPAEDERRARETAVEMRAAFEDVMRGVDALLVPGTPFPAPRHDEQSVTVAGVEVSIQLGGTSRYTRMFNVVPAAGLAFPVGSSAEGLPLGAQLVGPRRSEDLLLSAGVAFQRDTDWHLRVPPIHA